ncbi:2-aminoethanethiol dioxygenase [Phlebotomus papatasi]|uniref:2-aminoethanethiol dioxygenase n=1 Tax=Phlebotomus papatasi TaxID=29031 RepID=UPI00248411C9|nr:2-aminoethanethiol dioxygenase [Phlebotomus papatasi]
MSVHFARLVQQAKITFDQCNSVQFASNFASLQKLVDDLKVTDININPEIFSRRAFEVREKAPCSFVNIYECPIFSMSVFILAENYTMPLHDHPQMYGFLKCISGSVRVQSFTSIKDEPPIDNSSTLRTISVHVNQPKLLDSSSPASVLTPREGNFHEITAISGMPGAFFDILSPPYDSRLPTFGKRKCSFYRKTQISGECILEKIPTPLHYYCDNIHYEPPPFLRDD